MIAESFFWIAVGVFFYVLAGYPFLLSVLAFLFGAKESAYDFTPSVTVIVPAYNEEAVIRARIQNLLDQEYDAGLLKIIVVSDGSTDRTDAIVRTFEGTGRVTLIRQERQGKTAGLARAVHEAEGDLLVLTDANTFFEKRAVRELARPFAEERVGCVCGDLRLEATSHSTGGEGGYWSYETLIKKLESRLGSMLMGAGGIYALRRSDWPAIPRELADDSAVPLSLRVKGMRVVFAQEAVARERIAERVDEEFRRRVRMVAQDARLIRYFRLFLSPFRPWLLFQFLSHKWLRWNLAHLMIGILVSSAFLAGPSLREGMGFYALILALQGLFYASAVLGFLLERSGRSPALFSAPYYFAAANLAAMIGFWKGSLGSSQAVWEKAESTREITK